MTLFIPVVAVTRKGFPPSWHRGAGCPSETDKRHQPVLRRSKELTSAVPPFSLASYTISSPMVPPRWQ